MLNDCLLSQKNKIIHYKQTLKRHDRVRELLHISVVKKSTHLKKKLQYVPMCTNIFI